MLARAGVMDTPVGACGFVINAVATHEELVVVWFTVFVARILTLYSVAWVS